MTLIFIMWISKVVRWHLTLNLSPEPWLISQISSYLRSHVSCSYIFLSLLSIWYFHYPSHLSSCTAYISSPIIICTQFWLDWDNCAIACENKTQFHWLRYQACLPSVKWYVGPILKHQQNIALRNTIKQIHIINISLKSHPLVWLSQQSSWV